MSLTDDRWSRICTISPRDGRYWTCWPFKVISSRLQPVKFVLSGGNPLGVLHIAQLHIDESEAVHGLRVLGIDLERAAQIVESPQAVALPGPREDASSARMLAEVHLAEGLVVVEMGVLEIQAEVSHVLPGKWRR